MSRILLGVSGSIAAFKAAVLAGNLIKSGHEVRVILTSGGARFVTPLTFEALTGAPVASDLWDESPGDSVMGHIDLARWAELFVVAPAGAGAIARLAFGLPTDLLGATALATTAPLLIAPAMETNMWTHPATKTHIATLRDRGATIVGPESGRLASGAVGAGRMTEPEQIAVEIDRLLQRGRSLAGRRVLVTAGPTYEAIDPVRYLGNRSSGKMGYAIAAEAQARGAEVVLVSGPTSLDAPHGVVRIDVESAAQMRDAVLREASTADAIVFSAAVADYTPATVADVKLERASALTLELMPTIDISAETAAVAPNAVRVGFALQTDDLHRKARAKLERKGLHLILANELSDDHNPFGSEFNHVSFIDASRTRDLGLMTKREVASALWDEIEKRFPEQT
jgi:phosphopantothenoylcysteine decarboxylase / phosphopantothenate---cysteine ligase